MTAVLLAAAALVAGAPNLVVFRHVAVVPMDTERVLEDQIVVARDGTIVALGDEGKTAPPTGDVETIDGTGAFLLPGLADLHVHAQQPDDLFLYVANGVTTTLNLGLAWPNFVTQTRAHIRAGELLAPQCFVAPMLNGTQGGDLPNATVEQARASVRLAKRMGYEFVKVYNDLTIPLFGAICEEAHAQGLAVVGHAVRAPGLEASFDAGQVMVAHAEEYLYTVLRGANDRAGPDGSKVPDAVALTKRFHVTVVPNLSAYEAISRQWGRPEVVDGFLAAPPIRFMRPFWRRAWKESRYAKNGGSLGKNLDFLRGFTKALHDAGVRLIAGTDSPDIPGVQAGFSIHDDLQNLVEAGLTPFEALACATRDAGEFVAECVPDADGFGTVALGQRADLVLVAKNPLDDVANLREPIGVLLHGRWLPRAELARRLDEMAARFEATAANEAAFLDEGANSGWAAACAHAKAPLDEETLNETGYALLRHRKNEEAALVLELNTRIHPESANVFDSYGDVLTRLGRRDEARAQYAKELALDPHGIRSPEVANDPPPAAGGGGAQH